MILLLFPGARAVNILLNASPMAAVVLFWCGALAVQPLRQARKLLREQKGWGEPREYVFLPEEIRISHSRESVVMKWSVVTGLTESRSLFLLQLGKGSAIPVPKRFFAGPGEMDAWTQLARSRIGAVEAETGRAGPAPSVRDAITVRGSRELRDFQRAEYFTSFRRLWQHAILLAFFLLVFAAAFVEYVQGEHPGHFSAIIPFAVLFLLWTWSIIAPNAAARKKVAEQPWRTEPTTFAFHAEGMHVDCASSSSDIRWVVVKEACETRSLFLLFYSKQASTVIPKRFFESDAQIEAWKQLVQAQTGCRPIRPRGMMARWC